MHQQLYGHTTRSIVILHGLGGIGKTQLTIAYTKRHKDKYTAIFWMNASDEDYLKLSFRGAAQKILNDHPTTSGLAGVDLEGDLNSVVHAVNAWLSTPKNVRWLMIFDNYDNPKLPGITDHLAMDIRGFLPTADHGSMIITTRSAQVRLGRRIQVRKLQDIRDSLEILSNTSRRERITEGMLLDPT